MRPSLLKMRTFLMPSCLPMVLMMRWTDSRWFSSGNEALEAYPIFEEVWPWLLEKLNLIGG